MTLPFTVRSSCTILILILVFFGLASLTTSQKSGSSTISSSPRIAIRQDPAQETCGFAGSSDIYGVGIRIGYYAQALSIWFADFFVLREVDALRTVNTLFMFAMCIGLIFMSATPSQAYSVEAYIMIQIIFVVWFVGTLDVSRYSRKHWKFDFERTVIRNGCFLGMVVYNAWYWWAGLDLMQQTPCGTFGFFFSKVALYGWYRKANLVLSILAISGHVLRECGYLFRTLRRVHCRKINSAEYQGELQRRLDLAMDTTDPSRDCPADPEACSQIQRPFTPTSPYSVLRINRVPPTSFDQEMDTLPKYWPKKSPVVTTSETKNESDGDWPDFRELHAADTYISAVLSACPESILTGARFQKTFLHDAIRINIPYIRPPHSDNAVPLRTCLTTIFRAIRRRHFNSLAVGILVSYIYALQSQPFYRYPWFLHRALTEPTHMDQSWRTLAIMTSIRFTRIPDTTRRWYWIPAAVQNGLVTVGLVLSIELTLWWNQINGVNQFGTVGQLVPFVLGVGGLVKVLWSWLDMRFGTAHESSLEDGVSSPESHLAAAYYRRKEAYERSMGDETSDGVGHEENVRLRS